MESRLYSTCSTKVVEFQSLAICKIVSPASKEVEHQPTFHASIRSSEPVSDDEIGVKIPIASFVNPPSQTVSHHISLTDNIVQPVILPTPRLKDQSQMQSSLWPRWTRGLDKDILAVVGAQVIPRVRGEDIGLGINQAPVGTYVEDFT